MEYPSVRLKADSAKIQSGLGHLRCIPSVEVTGSVVPPIFQFKILSAKTGSSIPRPATNAVLRRWAIQRYPSAAMGANTIEYLKRYPIPQRHPKRKAIPRCGERSSRIADQKIHGVQR